VSTRREFARHRRLESDRYRGKIVVTEGISLPMLTSEIEEMGAVGIIAVNPGDRNHWSTASTIWGTPGIEAMARLPKVPSAGVNRQDGAIILAAAKRGETATIRTQLEQRLVCPEAASGGHRGRDRAGSLRLSARALR